MIDRFLRWPACRNVRDLGGLRTRDGRLTRSRVVVRADSLHQLTAEGRAELLRYGVRTVIDLRDPPERNGDHPFADHGEVRLLHLRWQSEEGLAAIRGLRSRHESDRRILALCGANIARVLTAVARAEGAAVIHCQGGRDRTGLAVALILGVAGVPEDAILEDYLTSDECLRPMWDEAIAKADPGEAANLRQYLAAAPDQMRATLAYLEVDRGGAAGYLLSAGMAEQDLGALRARLVDSG